MKEQRGIGSVTQKSEVLSSVHSSVELDAKAEPLGGAAETLQEGVAAARLQIVFVQAGQHTLRLTHGL